MTFPRIRPLRLLELASSLFSAFLDGVAIQSATNRRASLRTTKSCCTRAAWLRGCFFWERAGISPARSIDSTHHCLRSWLIRPVHDFAVCGLV